MESKKNVIEIVKMPSNQFEYEEHYYFTNVEPSSRNGTTIRMTGEIWEAARFNNLSSNEATAWCNFLKAILGKHYKINIKTITLQYAI